MHRTQKTGSFPHIGRGDGMETKIQKILKKHVRGENGVVYCRHCDAEWKSVGENVLLEHMKKHNIKIG